MVRNSWVQIRVMGNTDTYVDAQIRELVKILQHLMTECPQKTPAVDVIAILQLSVHRKTSPMLLTRNN